MDGGLAQLARAPALQAGGHRFESDILHYPVISEEVTIWEAIFDIIEETKKQQRVERHPIVAASRKRGEATEWQVR